MRVLASPLATTVATPTMMLTAIGALWSVPFQGVAVVDQIGAPVPLQATVSPQHLLALHQVQARLRAALLRVSHFCTILYNLVAVARGHTRVIIAKSVLLATVTFVMLLPLPPQRLPQRPPQRLRRLFRPLRRRRLPLSSHRRHHPPRSRRGPPRRAVQIPAATTVAMQTTATVAMGGLARSTTVATWETTAPTAAIGATQLARARTATRRA